MGRTLTDVAVRRRNASAWLLPTGDERTNHQLRRDMRRFDDDDEVDLVIVGCGAGGATVAQRLARAGWRVVALDAGPFWDPDADWVSDEAASHGLYWTEPRVISGQHPVPLGSNNSGRGVGGSMVHYAGYTPRFHPSDFATHTRDGAGALAVLDAVAQVGDADGPAGALVDEDAADHRVGPHLGPVRQRVGHMGDQR